MNSLILPAPLQFSCVSARAQHRPRALPPGQQHVLDLPEEHDPGPDLPPEQLAGGAAHFLLGQDCDYQWQVDWQREQWLDRAVADGAAVRAEQRAGLVRAEADGAAALARGRGHGARERLCEAVQSARGDGVRGHARGQQARVLHDVDDELAAERARLARGRRRPEHALVHLHGAEREAGRAELRRVLPRGLVLRSRARHPHAGVVR